MKKIWRFLISKIDYIWNYHRFYVYLGIVALIVLTILSFFIDIGYIFTIIAIILLYRFSDKTSKEDPDVLKLKENANRQRDYVNQKNYVDTVQLLKDELADLESYIENNPTDFVAWKRKGEIEDLLKDF